MKKVQQQHFIYLICTHINGFNKNRKKGTGKILRGGGGPPPTGHASIKLLQRFSSLFSRIPLDSDLPQRLLFFIKQPLGKNPCRHTNHVKSQCPSSMNMKEVNPCAIIAVSCSCSLCIRTQFTFVCTDKPANNSSSVRNRRARHFHTRSAFEVMFFLLIENSAHL